LYPYHLLADVPGDGLPTNSYAFCALPPSRKSKRHVNATVSRSLEQNSKHFNDAREKLEKWADDMVLAAEKALKDTKEQIKGLRPSGPAGCDLG
jgi:hypothetical protein